MCSDSNRIKGAWSLSWSINDLCRLRHFLTTVPAFDAGSVTVTPHTHLPVFPGSQPSPLNSPELGPGFDPRVRLFCFAKVQVLIYVEVYPLATHWSVVPNWKRLFTNQIHFKEVSANEIVVVIFICWLKPDVIRQFINPFHIVVYIRYPGHSLYGVS